MNLSDTNKTFTNIIKYFKLCSYFFKSERNISVDNSIAIVLKKKYINNLKKFSIIII